LAIINQALLPRLADKLGDSTARVYGLIQEISAKNRLPRHLGALLLAGDNRISIQKYATAQDLQDLRGVPHHVPVSANAVPDAGPPTRVATRRSRSGRTPKTKENTVFVVHGRDNKLRDSMYELLGALGLKALEWGHAIRAARGKGGNPYVNDAVTKVMEQAQAIVALLSPDDEVKLKPQFLTRHDPPIERKLSGQARPNVIFETRIAIGTHHRKTLIVVAGQVKSFTDIGGMHILRLTNSADSRHNFLERLEQLGCTVDRVGDHWLRVGDFTPTAQRTRATRATRGRRSVRR
jgi:predicted nucleotide-binding protein